MKLIKKTGPEKLKLLEHIINYTDIPHNAAEIAEFLQLSKYYTSFILGELTGEGLIKYTEKDRRIYILPQRPVIDNEIARIKRELAKEAKK